VVRTFSVPLGETTGGENVVLCYVLREREFADDEIVLAAFATCSTYLRLTVF
jgi:hypothetical protein